MKLNFKYFKHNPQFEFLEKDDCGENRVIKEIVGGRR